MRKASASSRWVDDDAGLQELVGALSEAGEFAFDTEFHRERTYWPQLALLQVAWEGGVALVDPMAVDIAPLGQCLLCSPLVVAHAAGQDLEVLDRACGCVPHNLFDTQVAAGFIGFSTPSLATLAERILDLHLPKGDRLTDWKQRPLSPAQVEYAAADVAYLLPLARLITEQLTAAGRYAWALQECREQFSAARAPQDPETAWWKIKEVRHLRGRSRAVAQEVAAWRERTAADLDRPVRTVLPDLAVLAVSTHPPSNLEQLRGLRGIEGRLPRGDLAAGLLDAVATGLELPPGDVHLPPSDDVDRGMRPAASLVSAWIGQLSRDLRIDASLLATRADLHAFIRGDPNARLLQGWRGELIGDRVRRLVSGDAALAFDKRGGLVLEERSRRSLVVTAPLPPADWSDA
ncbi:MAG TPA: HRDC domain-containing protein [Acidimicrobiales bacterium]|nr:HRDC domain-containing protein [Acidimicrobiales bacterium]